MPTTKMFTYIIRLKQPSKSYEETHNFTSSTLHIIPYPQNESSVGCERVHKFLTIPGSPPLEFWILICFGRFLGRFLPEIGGLWSLLSIRRVVVLYVSVVCERLHKFLTIPGRLPLGFKVHICFDFEPTSAWNNLTILVDQAFTSPGQTIPKRFKVGHFLGDDLMFGICPFLYTDMLY